jgi:hypothetical protein
LNIFDHVLEFAISVFELDLFAFEAFQQLVPGALLPRATLLPSHILLVKPISPSRAPAGGVGITNWLAAVRHFDQTNDRFGSEAAPSAPHAFDLCPLCPRKRTKDRHRAKSALCHFRTY